MNFFDHKDLGNHLLQLYPKVVKHPVYVETAKVNVMRIDLYPVRDPVFVHFHHDFPFGLKKKRWHD